MDPDIENIDDAAYLRALAHPLRLRILAMLGERATSPARLAARLGVRVNVVAYHVKRLRELGIAELVEVRRGRGGLEHFYAVRSRPAFTDDAWAQVDHEARRRILAAALRQVGDYVNGAALAGGFDRPDAHLSRTPIRVDEAGWRSLAAAAMDWLRAVDAIEHEVAERGSADLFDAGLVLMLFEAKLFSERQPREGRDGVL
jgi:DNA-binding transcriptional ArsR family regulator